MVIYRILQVSKIIRFESCFLEADIPISENPDDVVTLLKLWSAKSNEYLKVMVFDQDGQVPGIILYNDHMIEELKSIATSKSNQTLHVDKTFNVSRYTYSAGNLVIPQIDFREK